MFATASVAILSFAMAGGVATQASAQATSPAPAAPAAAPAQSVGEVVVTGSRIAKRDFNSNSPIVTVNAAAFQQTSNVAVDATLNKLPQFTPDQDLRGINAGDIQPTAIHTPGIATASLRGLGANRNLVLVDGQRMTPANGLNIIDLNTIPSAMIDHVETITGGASAVYGADAMSGVVNFILKKNFTGMDVDAQYGVSQLGDDREFKVSAIMGANFADDKGNVTVGVEHYTRSPTYQDNRSFFTNGWGDPTTGTNALFQFAGAYYSPQALTGGCSTAAAYSAIFGTAPSSQMLGAGFADQDGLCALGGAFSAPIYFNANGTVWTPGDGAPFNYGAWYTLNGNSPYAGAIDGTTVAKQVGYNSLPWFFSGGTTAPQPITTLKNNTTQYYDLSPINRWTLYMNGHYDINDDLTLTMRGNFASTETFTLQLPSTLINGWSSLIPYDETYDDPASPNYNPALGHPVPAELAQLLNARMGEFPFGNFPGNIYTTGTTNGLGMPTGQSTLGPDVLSPAVGTNASNTPWLLEYVPDPNNSWLPPRTTDTRDINWQISSGLDFKVPGTDWTGSLYGSHGETLIYSASGGNVDLDRYRDLLLAPDWGAGFNFLGNQGPVTGGGFGAGQGTCTSGLYNAIFFNQRPSQDCINAIEANLQSMTEVQQDVVEFDSQGTLFNLPAGPLKASLGADYRSDGLKFIPDTLQSETNFADQVAGLYPAAYVNAAVATSEGYGELDIPVLKDLPGVQSFSLNPGARFSTYTNSVSGWTYKLLGDWAVNNWIRFRGGYNLAVRAPTVAESYLGLQEVFGAGSAYGDPCNTNATTPYGANPSANLKGANAAKSALAICQAQMTAQGAAVFYATPGGAGSTTPGIFGWQNQIGNPDLKPEVAHTWTAGVVLHSPVANPWLSRTQLSVDWYKIKITGAIGFQDPDVVNQDCYQQNVLNSAGAVDPTLLQAAVNSPACQNSSRNTTDGLPNLTTVAYTNLGKIETSGFDAQLNWAVGFEAVGLNQIPGSVSVNILFNYLSHLVTNDGQPGAWDIDWAGTAGPGVVGVDAYDGYRWRLNTSLTYATGPASVTLNWRHLPGVLPAGVYNASATHITQPTNYLQSANTTLPIGSYDEFDLSGTYNLTKTVTLRAGMDNVFNVAPPVTAATMAEAEGAYPTIFPGVAASGAGSTYENVYDTIGRTFFVGINARF